MYVSPMAAVSRCHKLGGLRPHICILPCSRCSGKSPPDTQFLVVTSIPWLPRAGARHCVLHPTLLLSVSSALTSLFYRHLPWDTVPNQIIQDDLISNPYSRWQGLFPNKVTLEGSRVVLLCTFWNHHSTHDSKRRRCWAGWIKLLSSLRDLRPLTYRRCLVDL